MFAAEIIFKILKHLSKKDVYNLRAVSQLWKAQCEYHLFQLLKSRSKEEREMLIVKMGKDDKNNKTELIPVNYDCDHQMITFQTSSSLKQQIRGNQLQVVYSEWRQFLSIVALGYAQSLCLQDRALVMFHMPYNASMEHVYALPHWNKKRNQQYICDRGLIIKFSFIEDNVIIIDSILVNFSWILGGFNKGNPVSPLPLYSKEYQALSNMLLEEEGIDQYDEYTDSVADYILNDSNKLIIQTHSKRTLLWNKLEALSIHPRLVYKYSSAKNWLLKDNPVEDIDQVIQVIQNSEVGWSTKKLDLIRQVQ
ncbi:hypothetical protein INT46_001532 [Mucor plumbeus]|uniref:F-box domain-containing protein n=1 Tax=Mucor plumbeus TaxID=97098 RepID=A0A8H7ULV9_9FUNG|nr:hypothetical protein INT46_001532 [Mucor plumbeus]